MKNISFSLADISDKDMLSKIAYEAKRHWGYPSSLMELWKEDLIISEEHIQSNSVFKLTLDDEVIGFASISKDRSEKFYELEHMWILPGEMGHGYGAMLLKHALKHIMKGSFKKIKVVSDPNAVGFYEKQGFIIVGKVASVPEGRSLPLMEKSL